MSRVLNLVLLLSLFFIVSACQKEEEQAVDVMPTDVEIRIKNASAFDFEALEVEIGQTQSVYGDIASGATTEYKTFDYAYRNCFVELEIDDSIFTIQPIDFVGETVLEAGKYTYEIKAEENGTQYDRLSMSLIVD